MAIISSAIHRLLNLPLHPAAEEEEIKMIERIASINGLQVNVRRLIRRKRLRMLLSSPPSGSCSTSQRHKWVRLPFLGRFSYKLSSELRRLGYRTGFYPVCTVGQLSVLKDRLHKMQKSGIYRVTCGVCGMVYVGQTGRQLATRFHEHKTNVSSAFYSHCMNARHDPNAASVELLHHCSGGERMNRLEEVETMKSSKDKLLNNLDSVFFNHLIRFYYADGSG